MLPTFQDASFFTPATRRRYAEPRAVGRVRRRPRTRTCRPNRCPECAAGSSPTFDPLIGEWDIAVIGPHFAATLVARDLGDDGPDAERRFEFVLSHDRELAIAVATSLMSRISAGAADSRPATARSVCCDSKAGGDHVRAGADRTRRVAAADGRCRACLAARSSATRTGIAIADATAAGHAADLREPRLRDRSPATRPTDALGRNCRFLQGPGTDPRRSPRWRTRCGTNVHAVDADAQLPRRRHAVLEPAGAAPGVRRRQGTLTHYISVQDDVTARVEAEARVTYLAYHDQLTGLPNRALLLEQTRAGARTGQPAHDTATALLFIDLDDFKQINDQHGHHAGDMVLRRVAAQLLTATRGSDILARSGGDEFVLLLTDLDPADAEAVARRVADQVRVALKEPILLGDVSPAVEHITLNGSIGISLAPNDATTGQELIRHADAAMYKDKRGRDRRKS